MLTFCLRTWLLITCVARLNPTMTKSVIHLGGHFRCPSKFPAITQYKITKALEMTTTKGGFK